MKIDFQKIDTEELLTACRAGNSKAQMELYKRYYKAMYNIALRILNDTGEAEDVMQESFLSAFQKLETYRGEVTFGSWLKKIVINRSLDILKVRKTIITLEAAPEIENDEPDEDYLKYKELSIEIVKKALMDLPEGYRVVLTLYLIEGYDHEEISQILKISNATSRTQYHRAKKHLAAKLNKLKAVS
jgi:RNA polymerase sigma-70 factor (ECF subfamily)